MSISAASTLIFFWTVDKSDAGPLVGLAPVVDAEDLVKLLLPLCRLPDDERAEKFVLERADDQLELIGKGTPVVKAEQLRNPRRSLLDTGVLLHFERLRRPSFANSHFAGVPTVRVTRQTSPSSTWNVTAISPFFAPMVRNLSTLETKSRASTPKSA